MNTSYSCSKNTELCEKSNEVMYISIFHEHGKYHNYDKIPLLIELLGTSAGCFLAPAKFLLGK